MIISKEEIKHYDDRGVYVCTYVETVEIKKGKRIRTMSLKPIKAEDYDNNSTIG